MDGPSTNDISDTGENHATNTNDASVDGPSTNDISDTGDATNTNDASINDASVDGPSTNDISDTGENDDASVDGPSTKLLRRLIIITLTVQSPIRIKCHHQ